MEGVANKMSQLGRRKGRKACVQNGGESILPFLQASKLVPWMLEEDMDLNGQRQRTRLVYYSQPGSAI